MASSSGSGGRSPRDLRDIVHSSKSNKGDDLESQEEFKAKLEKLRALSKDDLSENAMLRSRIDQQSELICILKQRADECLKESIQAGKENEEIKSTREDIIAAMHAETRKYCVLQKRFDVLNSNHQEMIAIKDDYKTKNEKLRRENERLRHENEVLFADTVKQRDEEIKGLREEAERLQEKCSLAEERQRKTEDEMAVLTAEAAKTASELRNKITKLEYHAADKEQERDDAFLRANQELKLERQRVTSVQRERDEFAQLALERGKALKEKREENAKQLARLEEAERTLKEMEDKFNSELETMSSNAQVRRLKKQLDEVEKRHHEQLKEYEAYKKHTSTMLAKEKRLNDKLRVLIG